MIVIRALDGTAVDVDENAVTLVSGPYPHDVGPHTYVHGVDRGVLVTAEDAAALASRLGVNPPLAKLTRPNQSPVWIKGPAVTTLRAPLSTERQGRAAVNAVVILGDLHQAVRENLATTERVLNAHGAHL
ncbi:MAG: hypothetical protein JO081_16340 [Alphaproteobacteria bacterium]|nr:hypothetical protein [Alphaproteobacteria bacterium]